jgi:hypothetical protein
MASPLYRVIAGGRDVAEGVPLAEVQPVAGFEAVVCQGRGPTMYAAPRPDGACEWVEWPEAQQRGWTDNHGQPEYPGCEPEARFLVLYYPPPFRAWPYFWRVVQPKPRRVELCRSEGQAVAAAEYWIRRRQVGFHSEGWRGVRRAWGWDDREIAGHGECYDGCGCDGPAWMRDYVLIAEFESEAPARVPDVNLELEAWKARLDPARALAITAPCDGTCEPACAHCSATYEETMAAWEWLSGHRREVREWRRQRRQEAAGC